jgi:hypothetical protein
MASVSKLREELTGVPKPRTNYVVQTEQEEILRQQARKRTIAERRVFAA